MYFNATQAQGSLSEFSGCPTYQQPKLLLTLLAQILAGTAGISQKNETEGNLVI